MEPRYNEHPGGLANCVHYNKVLLYQGSFYYFWCKENSLLHQNLLYMGYIEVSLYDEEKYGP